MTGGRTRTPVWALAVGVVLVLVLLAAGLVGYRAWQQVEDAEADQQRRDEVSQAASQFVHDLNTFSYDDMEAHRDRMLAQTTGRVKDEFEQQFPGLADLAETTKLTSDGSVLRTGIASVDADSAAVLVVADATAQSTVQTRERFFRAEVSLTRVDGEWLVDDFTPIVE